MKIVSLDGRQFESQVRRVIHSGKLALELCNIAKAWKTFGFSGKDRCLLRLVNLTTFEISANANEGDAYKDASLENDHGEGPSSNRPGPSAPKNKVGRPKKRKELSSNGQEEKGEAGGSAPICEVGTNILMVRIK